MKKIFKFPLILCTILSAAVAFNVFSQESRAANSELLRAEETIMVTVTANVEAIDYETREVILLGPLGNVVNFVVDERVERLDEIAVGDMITAEYYVSIAGELRAPTEEERQNPLTILEGGGRTPEGTTPAGGVLRAFKVVAVVIGLDLPTQTVTLLGPQGNTGSIRARNTDNLRMLRLGDTIIVTYTEALAISLEKTSLE